MDNSRLEEIMAGELTAEMQEEFFEIFSKSKLLMPVTYAQNSSDEHVGFSISYLTDENGNNAIPLFTSEKVMDSIGLDASSMEISMTDLAEMLRQTDKYSIIAVNPFTDNDINMPIDAFMGLFEDDMLDGILKVLREKSRELEEDYAFFVRGSEPFMKNESVGGVFTPDIPFNASTRRDFRDDLRYLNIILMPKTKKMLYIGGVVDDDHYDVIIAPGSEFHLVEEIDEFTSVWKCGNQPFYD